MPLFFFISAYFTPTSCDRKGARIFLKEKIKRLLPPLVLYALALGPLMRFVIASTLTGETYSYSPDPGPTWFLGWLLIFNFAYCLVDATDNYHHGCPIAGSIVCTNTHTHIHTHTHTQTHTHTHIHTYIHIHTLIGALPLVICLTIHTHTLMYNTRTHAPLTHSLTQSHSDHTLICFARSQ
jgi:hypothetical protein